MNKKNNFKILEYIQNVNIPITLKGYSTFEIDKLLEKIYSEISILLKDLEIEQKQKEELEKELTKIQTKKEQLEFDLIRLKTQLSDIKKGKNE
ncbi:hypothetical protein [Mycoplasma sp. CSL7503-lung]|uniref:hypothetical protein n=1 Tax=Mycoplasma sp. CSL7503-lung TaxID=536372 RepID=UPI0021D31989|nr:hypothetical protein [Mycoplasma sp. CSL7503-lung]MCU4706390.1 hypothetical protein [Mycoplasma sp. CSL7503-lung]